MKILYCNNEGKSNLEVVSILKESVNRLFACREIE